MTKTRVPVPCEVAAKVLVASAHTCCKCEERGKPIQIHHIDGDPANNDLGNLAVLCLTCHAETQVSGGFSRHLSAADVRLYRDQMVDRVARRRGAADATFIARATKTIAHPSPCEAPKGLTRMQDAVPELERYIDELPNVLSDAYSSARRGWGGSTADARRATFDVIEVVKRMCLQLAAEFPDGHFAGKSPDQFLEEHLSQRFAWRAAMAEPRGYGTGGTSARLRVSMAVLNELEAMVVEMVEALRGSGHSRQAARIWLGYWEGARENRGVSPEVLHQSESAAGR